jgi:hypothetical protein
LRGRLGTSTLRDLENAPFTEIVKINDGLASLDNVLDGLG